MIDNFKETRKICNNVISPVYYQLHAADGKPETGTNREKMIEQMLAILQPEGEKTSPATAPASPVDADADVPVATEADTGGPPQGNTEGGMATPAAATGKKATVVDILPFWLTWLNVGPLAIAPSKPNHYFIPPVKKPKRSRAKKDKPKSRQVSREDFLKDVKGNSKRAPKLSLSEVTEKRKADALERLTVEERKKRKLAEAALNAKKVQDEFDSAVARLEKRITYAKGGTKITLTAQLEELLYIEEGPAEPEQVANSEEEDGEEVAEAADGDE